MMMKNKKIIFSIIFLLVATVVGTSIYSFYQNRHQTLTIGIYTGSSWNVPNGHQYHMIDYAIHQFKKTHPNVKINYESGIKKNNYIDWLSEKIVSGQTPDIIIMPQENFDIFASEQAFKDISSFVNRDHLKDKFYPATLNAGKYHGKQYTLPYETNPTLLVTNQSLLKREKINLKSPNGFKSVNEFKQICRYMSNKSGIYGITSSYDWQDAQLAYGSKIFSGNDQQLHLTDNQVRKGFTLIQSLHDNSLVHNVTNTMFDQGKVALMPLSFAQYRSYTSYPYYVTRQAQFKIQAIKMPGKKSTPASTVGFGISSHSSKTELAWQFIKTLCADRQVQQELMKTQMGCSVMPKVIKSKKTSKILAENESTKSSIDNLLLDQILKDEVTYPKFKNYQSLMHQLDYQINEALQNGTLNSQLSTIQSNINRQLWSYP